jgi:nitroreductase
MAIESPLFQSAMELLGHSLTHYNGKNELDRKLVILHLANAVELILKDLVLDAGESIYKSPKETITIHGCLAALESKDTKLPFINKIELLIDERNALQHRFGSPNQLTSIFYMNIAQEFFKEVLKKHYGLDYNEVISQFADEQALAALRLGEPSNDQELEKLQELAKLHPLGALLSAWSYFERHTDKFLDKVGLTFGTRRPFIIEVTRGRLEKYGVEIPDELMDKINTMRKVRNIAAHGHGEPTRDDVIQTIKTIESVEKFLDETDLEKIQAAVKIEKDRYEAHMENFMKEREQRFLNRRHQRPLELDATDSSI